MDPSLPPLRNYPSKVRTTLTFSVDVSVIATPAPKPCATCPETDTEAESGRPPAQPGADQ